jgi:hypothetical protein
MEGGKVFSQRRKAQENGDLSIEYQVRWTLSSADTH